MRAAEIRAFRAVGSLRLRVTPNALGALVKMYITLVLGGHPSPAIGLHTQGNQRSPRTLLCRGFFFRPRTLTGLWARFVQCKRPIALHVYYLELTL